MQSSPIQTQSIVYGELSIVPYMPEGDESSDADGFDWAGVKFDIAVKYDELERDGRPAYPVFLRIRVPNNGEGKKAPYAITAAIMGGFVYSGDKSKEDALDLVVVNGLSILYSSLREMILTTTTRMINGALYLPGANFMDHAPSLRNVVKKASPKKAPLKQALKAKKSAAE